MPKQCRSRPTPLLRTCCPYAPSSHSTNYHRVNMSSEQMVLVKTHMEWLLSNGSSVPRRGVMESLVVELTKHLACYRRLPPCPARPMELQRT